MYSLISSPSRCNKQLLSLSPVRIKTCRDNLRILERPLRVVELRRVGDYSEIFGRQLCGIAHVVPVDRKAVAAAEHYE